VVVVAAVVRRHGPARMHHPSQGWFLVALAAGGRRCKGRQGRRRCQRGERKGERRRIATTTTTRIVVVVVAVLVMVVQNVHRSREGWRCKGRQPEGRRTIVVGVTAAVVVVRNLRRYGCGCFLAKGVLVATTSIGCGQQPRWRCITNGRCRRRFTPQGSSTGGASLATVTVVAIGFEDHFLVFIVQFFQLRCHLCFCCCCCASCCSHTDVVASVVASVG